MNNCHKNCEDRCTKWLGWPSHHYPPSTTTVTTTPILSPIPGPRPYSYKFSKVDIAYSRFHMEYMHLQGQSPLPPNFPSLPSLSDGIQNLPSCWQAIMDLPHTRTDDTCLILPSWPSSGTATTITWLWSLRLTATFPRIIRHKPPPMKKATAIMTTTREEMAEYNWQEGVGHPGWGIWRGQRSLSHVVTETWALGSLPIVQMGGVRICQGWQSIRWLSVTVAAKGQDNIGKNSSSSDTAIAEAGIR